MARFHSRSARKAAIARMALLFHLRRSHIAVTIAQRRLRLLNLRFQFHCLIGGPRFTSLRQTLLKQVTVHTTTQVAMAPSTRQGTLLVRTGAPPSVVPRPTQTLPRVLAGAHREFTTLLKRRYVDQREWHSLRHTERRIHRCERREQTTVQEHMTLRREARITTRAVVEAAPQLRPWTPEVERTAFSPLPPPAATPHINVDELTERVIHQIDHRVTARRERMGRM